MGEVTLCCGSCGFTWHFLTTFCPNCKAGHVTLPGGSQPLPSELNDSRERPATNFKADAEVT